MADTTSAPTIADREQKINEMYDASLIAAEAPIISEYSNKVADAEYEKNQIPKEYADARNELAANNEINRRNTNMAAADSGLNSGTVAQENTARSNAYQNDVAENQAAEAEATAEADRNITSLKEDYDAAIAEATASNDYNRASAILDEYNQAYNRAMTQASNMANYGDFSGYAAIYGQAAADNMQQVWNLQNPEAAYTMGRINATQYLQLTGREPTA